MQLIYKPKLPAINSFLLKHQKTFQRNDVNLFYRFDAMINAEKIIREATGAVLKKMQPLGGGCINNAFKIETDSGPFFLKYNDNEKYPGMFKAESNGLQLLKATNTLHVPGVIATGNDNKNAYLLLEWIEPAGKPNNFFFDFGVQLAAMHCNSSEFFGLDHDNYIGSLQQKNNQHKNGIDFFIECRLQPQLIMAFDRGAFENSILTKFELLYKLLPSVLPNEQPALLHGDLWNGNFMVNSTGSVTLIDPAVYYGFGLSDIAMTKLFGGFDNAFYEGYYSTFPKSKHEDEIIGVLNLYPLLVHVNLFGGAYAARVKNTLNRF